MSRGKASGYVLAEDDIPTVLGMLARGDRDHDVAGWFGVNQGRIADAKAGKWGTPASAPSSALPPAGPPAIKGKRLKMAVDAAVGQLLGGNEADALKWLQAAVKDYNRDE